MKVVSTCIRMNKIFMRQCQNYQILYKKQILKIQIAVEMDIKINYKGVKFDKHFCKNLKNLQMCCFCNT